MQQSYLIQRLQKPWIVKGKAAQNPFAFGGGYRNGGLTEEAMEMLSEIFSFDYMGSAEFEFGALPKALNEISRRENLTAFTINIPFKHRLWRERKDVSGNADVYVICSEPDKKEVEKYIRGWALDEPLGRTKESVNLARSLAGDDGSSPAVGWLELDNGYFFFTDKEMFEKTRALFLGEAAAAR